MNALYLNGGLLDQSTLKPGGYVGDFGVQPIYAAISRAYVNTRFDLFPLIGQISEIRTYEITYLDITDATASVQSCTGGTFSPDLPEEFEPTTTVATTTTTTTTAAPTTTPTPTDPSETTTTPEPTTTTTTTERPDGAEEPNWDFGKDNFEFIDSSFLQDSFEIQPISPLGFDGPCMYVRYNLKSRYYWYSGWHNITINGKWYGRDNHGAMEGASIADRNRGKVMLTNEEQWCRGMYYEPETWQIKLVRPTGWFSGKFVFLVEIRNLGSFWVILGRLLVKKRDFESFLTLNCYFRSFWV